MSVYRIMNVVECVIEIYVLRYYNFESVIYVEVFSSQKRYVIELNIVNIIYEDMIDINKLIQDYVLLKYLL